MIDTGFNGYRDIPIEIAPAAQLESDPDLGSDIDEGGFLARVADSPIGYSVPSLFEKLGNPLADANSLYKRFGVWLIPHRVSIIRRSGLAEPTSVGIEVQYQNEGRTCSIVSLFPSFQFVEHGTVGLKCNAIMSATGELALESASGEEAVSVAPSVRCGATLHATAGAKVGLDISATVVTPTVSSVGIGSQRCEWRFDKRSEPLFGKDIETWAVVALPKRQKHLDYDVRFYFSARAVFFGKRRESEWTRLVCSLAG